jgi:hypothetical protein
MNTTVSDNFKIVLFSDAVNCNEYIALLIMNECILRIGALILTGESEVPKEKLFPVPLRPLDRLIWD